VLWAIPIFVRALVSGTIVFLLYQKGRGSRANQHVLLALQADAQLAISKPEAALTSVIAGLKAVEKGGRSAA
jgi:hypothetical protein